MDCRTLVQQLVSSIPQRISRKTTYKTKEQEIGTQRKTVTFKAPDQGPMKIDSKYSEQESLSGESDTEESGDVDGQDQVYKVLSGVF